jgi:hypothetical protein
MAAQVARAHDEQVEVVGVGGDDRPGVAGVRDDADGNGRLEGVREPAQPRRDRRVRGHRHLDPRPQEHGVARHRVYQDDLLELRTEPLRVRPRGAECHARGRLVDHGDAEAPHAAIGLRRRTHGTRHGL